MRIVAVGGAVSGVLGFGGDYGWRYWTVGRFQESTDDAYVRADSTIVAPKVAGQVAAVLVGDDEPVRAGRALARIDDRDYRTALDEARANVAASEASAEMIRATIAQQAASVVQARASLALDQANLVFAQQESERSSTLAERGAGTVRNAQQATSALGAAKQTIERDEAALKGAELQVSVLKAQLTRAEAGLAHDAATAEQARLNLGYTDILAPIDGVVGDRTVRVGQYVQPGTALMGLVPLDAVYVVANFKETQLTDVRRGQSVDVEVDGFPGHVVKGTVDTLAPATGQEFALLPPDNATGNFTKVVQRVPVRISLDPRDALIGRLRPGMSVTPTIDVRPEKDRS